MRRIASTVGELWPSRRCRVACLLHYVLCCVVLEQYLVCIMCAVFGHADCHLALNAHLLRTYQDLTFSLRPESVHERSENVLFSGKTHL